MMSLPKDVKRYIIVENFRVNELLQWRGLFGLNREWRYLMSSLLGTEALQRSAHTRFSHGYHRGHLEIGNWPLGKCKRMIAWLQPESLLSALIFLHMTNG